MSTGLSAATVDPGLAMDLSSTEAFHNEPNSSCEPAWGFPENTLNRQLNALLTLAGL
jgi:hypothetical protein